MGLTRRQFGRVVSGGFAAAAASRATQLPDPRESGIEHIVVVTMENRSFDHLLGWLPGTERRQAGLSYVDNTGRSHPTFPLAPDYTGCGHPDPDHSYAPSRVAYNGGAMNGFLRAGANDSYAIGYYGASDIPFYGALAQNYTVCDRYFASILGPTLPNRMFLWAAQTEHLDDSIALTNVPTIFDRLFAAGVSHRYYFNNIPYLALWGFRYLFSADFFSSFLTSAAAGTLPAVSFVDPAFTLFDDGTGNDDHPHSDIRNGDAFLSTVFRAVASSPKWRNTVLIVTFDEWGGFFEHVAPPRAAAANNVDTDQVDGKVLLGFRVPTVIASPFTRNLANSTRVSSVLYDHTSVLKLIEWRWGLSPLTARDASPEIGNLAAVMDFQSPRSEVPVLPVVHPVTAPACFGGSVLSSASSFSSAEQTRVEGEAGALRMKRAPWATLLASSPVARQWLQHPRFTTKRER